MGLSQRRRRDRRGRCPRLRAHRAPRRVALQRQPLVGAGHRGAAGRAQRERVLQGARKRAEARDSRAAPRSHRRAQNPAALPAASPCTGSLPNVGNEGHTYLWHIVHSWDALPDLLLLLPDTVEYGDKLKTWRRVKANLERVGRSAYYADDYTPITGARFALNFLNEVFYGACIRTGGMDGFINWV